MTELQVKTKKGSLKKFFAMFLAVCVCLTTIQVNAAFTETTDGETTVSVSKKTMELDVAGKKTDEITITSNKKQTVTEWKVSPDNANADVIEGPNGKPMVTPEGAGEAVVSSSNTQTVPVKVDVTVTGDKDAITYKVDGAKITVEAKKAGKATVVVTDPVTKNSDSCAVNVKDTTKKVINPTGVTLDKKTLTLDLNGTKTGTLKATVAPAGANQTVTWQSSDANVATVAGGTVTAKKVGKTTITATVPGTKLTATCAVEVKDSTPAKDNNTNKPNKTVKVKKVVASAKTVYVVAGKKVTLGATVEPANATNKKITWSTAKKSVASVKAAKNGASVTITAGKKAAGKKTTVTAKASGKSAKVTVNVVKKAKKATSVKLSKKTAKMNTGDKLALTATLNKGATSTIKWSVSKNKGVATVKNGVVTAGKNAGVVTITAKADKKSAKCVITVTKKGAKVTLNPTKKTIKVKKSFTIKLKKKASGDAIKSCTSSNKKVATVTNKGKVTGKKAGKADITVITKKGAVATCKVTVKK
ncbi:hypothetical protein C810_00952 [Lachnospiraceae bacterium A2]|nr:hypothetical protein C810_00952 [Lachnospiraceae bacterium A2]